MDKIKQYINLCFSYIEKCKKEIDKYDIISFDCWDTLIVRPFHDPYIIQQYIDFSYYKNRFRNLKHCAYDIEKSIEMLLCQPRTDIYKLYEYAKQKNKKIIVISDFYFDKYFIQKLLIKCGYNFDINDINISCDFSTNKLEFLYKKIIDKYHTNKILHIGDNKQADYEIPLKYGMMPFFIPSIHQNFKQIFEYNFNNNIIFSAFIGRLANNILKYNNIHAQLGALFSFIPEAALNHSIKICKKYNSKSMLFIGRDMYIPYYLFNKYYKNGEDYIVQYVDTKNRKIINNIYPIDNSIICQCSTTHASIQNNMLLLYKKKFNYAVLQSGGQNREFNMLIMFNTIPNIRHITEAALRAPYIIENNKITNFKNIKQQEEYIPRISAECEFNYLKKLEYTDTDFNHIFNFIFKNFNYNQIVNLFTYYRED